MSYLSAYSADNAPINYGVHNSVYQKLLEKSLGVIKANCQCHVIHNAGRNACKMLSYDIESLVLKVYAEFSNSAKRVAELKIFFEDFDMEYQKVIRHVSTRWLSLYRSVDRLIRSWPAVKAYFLKIGEEQIYKR